MTTITLDLFSATRSRSIKRKLSTAFAFLIAASQATTVMAQTITFSGANLPCITYNIATALQAGRPSQLTRTTNQQTIQQNRQASCGGVYAQTVTQLNQQYGATVMSCDEYAFASTTQGGAGNQAMIVPIAENNSQGGQLSAFYNQNNIGNGNNFNVAVANVRQANQLNLGFVNGVQVCYGAN